ncbi:hypothetical protein [Kitasatospora sp. NPDC047058]|uniref:hypothetical protein n=1 Tax=Kitasatospora sp. NPDC047058 TaxID=3155620 RepID=UPI0033E4E1E4
MITGARAATPEDLRWEERAADLAFNELPNLRATAERWVASLGGVLGILGVVLVVKGPSDITGIHNSVLYVLTGVLLAGAVVAALLAIILGAFAAQGTPRQVELYSGPYIRERYRREARTVARQLRRSRVAAVVAVVLLGAAIGTTWYGTPRASTVSSTTETGQAGVR